LRLFGFLSRKSIRLPSLAKLEADHATSVADGNPESLIERRSGRYPLEDHRRGIAGGTGTCAVADRYFGADARPSAMNAITELHYSLSAGSLSDGELAIARAGADEAGDAPPGLTVHSDRHSERLRSGIAQS
jgi:hypothetical protein